MAYSDEDLNWIYDRTDGACFYCDKRLSCVNYGLVGARGAWEVDHFIPIARNGPHQPSNWVAACVPCNTEKRDFLPWEFDPQRFSLTNSDPDGYL